MFKGKDSELMTFWQALMVNTNSNSSNSGIETVDDNDTEGGKVVISIMVYVTLDFAAFEPDVSGKSHHSG